MHNSYTDLMAIAEEEAERVGVDINTALKEILHYDILHALSDSSLGDRLVFQGGTALRLCHQGNRYSEDLDFVAGKPDVFEHMEVFKTLLERSINDRYGLDVRFKDPNRDRKQNDPSVHRWMAVVNVPSANKALPQVQKIKIEVCDVPSHDNEPRFIERNYQGLSPGFDHILLRVSTLREIMADKVLAAVGRFELKPRDVWDLHWLGRKGATVDLSMIDAKLSDYHESESFDANIDERIQTMQDSAFVAVFNKEMSRFLSGKMRRALTDIPDFTPRLVREVATTLEQVRDARLMQKPGVFVQGPQL